MFGVNVGLRINPKVLPLTRACVRIHARTHARLECTPPWRQMYVRGGDKNTRQEYKVSKFRRFILSPPCTLPPNVGQANESSSADVLLNKTETTYFGFDTDSNNSNVRGVPHAVSAPQQAYGQTTQNPTNEPNDAAEEDAVNAKKESEEAADAKAPKTNSGGQEKSTSSRSKDDSRKESDWKWYISLSLSPP